MTQDELKKAAAWAALEFVEENTIVGVGTGSTVNHFIDALGSIKDTITGAVSSSDASTEKLKALGIEVFELNDVASLDVYVDGADEINAHNEMIKGGGAALTREKEVDLSRLVFWKRAGNWAECSRRGLGQTQSEVSTGENV